MKARNDDLHYCFLCSNLWIIIIAACLDRCEIEIVERDNIINKKRSSEAASNSIRCGWAVGGVEDSPPVLHNNTPALNSLASSR